MTNESTFKSTTEASFVLPARSKQTRALEERLLEDGLSALIGKKIGDSPLRQLIQKVIHEELEILTDKLNNIPLNLNIDAVYKIINLISINKNKRISAKNSREIPTILVFGDSDVIWTKDRGLFQCTVSALKKSCVSAIIPPDSFKSISGFMKLALGKLILTWAKRFPTLSKKHQIGLKDSSAIHFTFETLEQAYFLSSEKIDSFVIFIPRFTDLDSSIIEDFLYICSERINLPLTLIFGVSTYPEIFYQSMSHNSLTVMNLKKINLKPSIECLDIAVDELLLKRENGFKLHYESLKFIISRLKLYEISMAYLFRQWSFSILDFYSNQSMSLFGCIFREGNDISLKDLLSDVNNLRYGCTVIRNHIEELSKVDPKTTALLLLDDGEFIQYINKCLNDLITCSNRMDSGFKCLNVLYRILNCGNGNFPTFSLYVDALEGLISKNHPFMDSILKRMRESSLQELNMCVIACLDIMEKSQNLHQLEEIIYRLSVMATQTKFRSDFIKMLPTGESNQSSDRCLLEPLGHTENDFKTTDMSTENNKLIDQVVNTFLEMIVTLLKSPMTYPLHEMVYYKYTEALENATTAKTLEAIYEPLKSPIKYTNISSLETLKKQDFREKNMRLKDESYLTDASMAYKIYSESSRIIDLHEFYREFSENFKDRISSDDETLKARFIALVFEFNHIGLLRLTPTNPNQAIKLVW